MGLLLQEKKKTQREVLVLNWLRTLSWVLTVLDWSLTDVLLLTLKSQEQKTLTARFPVDLRTWNLFPQEVDILQENKVAVKIPTAGDPYRRKQKTKKTFRPPVDQDDADNEEGDGSGEEVGGRYAVRLSSATDGRIRSSTGFDGGIGVVAVKH